jgi:hypothetical protein
MTLQLSTTLRTTQAGDLGTALGANFTIKIFSGTQPANCAAVDSGTLLATFTSVNVAAASAGAQAINGTPYSATAAGTATAGYFRAYNTTGPVCHAQGTVATSAADMTIDNATIVSGQTVNLTAWSYTRSGA